MHARSQVLFVVGDEDVFQGLVGLTDVFDVVLITFHVCKWVKGSITYTLVSSNQVRFSMGIVMFKPGSEHIIFLLGFAEIDLLFVGEVIRDVLGLVALASNSVQIIDLHSLKSW